MSVGKGPAAFLLGPGEGARLVIDRPAPGPAREVHVAPAPADAFAVAALAVALLSAARGHLSLPAATQSCLLAAVYGDLSSPRHPERAFRRMHLCLKASGLSTPATLLPNSMSLARTVSSRSAGPPRSRLDSRRRRNPAVA